MSISWLEQIKSWFLLFARRCLKFFHPESSRDVRRLQVFWLSCGTLGIIVLSYGIGTFLFGKAPPPQHQEEVKVIATPIETVTKKVNLDDAFRHSIDNKLQALSDKITAVEKLFQEGVKQGDFSSQELETETQDQSLNSPFSQLNSNQELEAKISHLEEQLESQRNNMVLSQPFSSSVPQDEQEKNLIQKTTLNLTENPQHKTPKTVETTIPAGAFARTVLLSGLDASSAMTASSDPRPMLLRLIDFGTLPRRFQSDLKDCHCTASAYGDLSSERIYARLEKLTCIERKTGEIIETQVAGYIAGPDGKAGIRGIVASKEGQFLGRSLVGGMFAGLSNVANPQNRQQLVNPFSPGSAHVSPPSVGETFTSGMAGGASSALDRLSQYYIDRAEQLQPVIQVSAGQVVDIVFTQGTFIGAQEAHAEIKNEKVSSDQ